MSKIYLDKNGYEEYLKEIDNLKEQIKENNTNITEYQSSDAYGDGWHDNFAYEQARKYEDTLFHQLNKKIYNLSNIVIVDDKLDDNQVGLNCIVSILFDGEDDIEKYFLTGSYNSNMDCDIPIITLNSPLGEAIYKKIKGESFLYNVNEKTYIGKIVDIYRK